MSRLIDQTRCIGCGACKETCLVGCIETTEDGTMKVDESACVDCGACTLVCPMQCIYNI